jgi:integrase
MFHEWFVGQEGGSNSLRSDLLAKRSLNRLTAQAVKNEKKPGLHNDGGNLYLSIQPGGTKSWVFRYTRNGKAREMGLGPADHDGRNGGVTLARARILATDARRLLHDGKCPLGERRRLAAEASAAAARAAVKSAFRDVAESWFEAQKKGWKNAKHIATVKASLESSYPVLGSMHVADITTDDVLAVLSPIWHTTTESTTRLRQRIEAVLSYAKARKLRTGDNPAAWRDNLKHILPPPESIHIEQNQPSLPWERMPEFLVALRSMEPSASRLALEFQILTAVRPNEAARAEWTEFDFDKGVWTIPADRMKGRRGKTVAHSVWLTPAMRRVLQEARALPRAVGSRYVFPGKLPGKPLSEQATNELVKGMCETTHRDDGLPFWCEPSTGRRVVPHGFRSSFTVFAQDGSLARKEVTEACLAHIISDKVYAAYGRSKFERMRFQAHLAWEHFLYEGEVKRVDIGEIPLAA